MPILVVTTLADRAQADAFLQLLDGAAAVLGPRGSVEVTPLGAYGREIKGKSEAVCAAVVEPKSSRSDAIASAHDFEQVLRSMVAAGGLQGCEPRAYAR